MTESISKPVLWLSPGAWSTKTLLALPGGVEEIPSHSSGYPSAVRAERSGRGVIWHTGNEAIQCKQDVHLQTLIWGPVCGMARESPMVFGETSAERLSAKDLLAESIRPLIRKMTDRFGTGGFLTKIVVPDSFNQAGMSTLSGVVAIAGASSHTLHRAAVGVLNHRLELTDPWPPKKICLVVDLGFSGIRVVRFDVDETKGGWFTTDQRVIQLAGMEELFEQAWDEAVGILIGRSNSEAVIPEMRWRFSAMVSGLDAAGVNQSGIPRRQWHIWTERAALDLSQRLSKAIESEMLTDEPSEEVLVLLSGGGATHPELVKILCEKLPWACEAVPDPGWAALRGHVGIGAKSTPHDRAHSPTPHAEPTPENLLNPLQSSQGADVLTERSVKGQTLEALGDDTEPVTSAVDAETNVHLYPAAEQAVSESAKTPARKDRTGKYLAYQFNGRDTDGKAWMFRIEPEDWPESQRLVVGRSDQNSEIILPHESVSRVHAALIRRGRDLYVSDLGSANGSVVNGQILTEGARPKVMLAGDTVRFGNLNFRFSLDHG